MMARFARLWAAPPRRRGLAALAALALCAALACGMVACSEGPAPAKLPAATPAPTPSLARARPQREKKVWADPTSFPPIPWPGSPMVSLLLRGCVFRARGASGSGMPPHWRRGGCIVYSTRDGGKTLETSQYDLAPFLGQEPFQVSNYQMVSESTGFLVVRMGEGRQYQTDSDSSVPHPGRRRKLGPHGPARLPSGRQERHVAHPALFVGQRERGLLGPAHPLRPAGRVAHPRRRGSLGTARPGRFPALHPPTKTFPACTPVRSGWIQCCRPRAHIVARCYACADNTAAILSTW